MELLFDAEDMDEELQNDISAHGSDSVPCGANGREHSQAPGP
jgi:hypothetical protein